MAKKKKVASKKKSAFKKKAGGRKKTIHRKGGADYRATGLTKARRVNDLATLTLSGASPTELNDFFDREGIVSRNQRVAYRRLAEAIVTREFREGRDKMRRRLLARLLADYRRIENTLNQAEKEHVFANSVAPKADVKGVATLMQARRAILADMARVAGIQGDDDEKNTGTTVNVNILMTGEMEGW